MAVKIKDLYEKLDSGNNGFKKITNWMSLNNKRLPSLPHQLLFNHLFNDIQ